MKISIVVAQAENGVIGHNNDLIWHLPRDLAFFKKITTGHTILMGSKTYAALGKPLPNRKHIIISRTKTYDHPMLTSAQSVEAGIAQAAESGCEHLYITGGGMIYAHCFENHLADELFLTTVHHPFEGDTSLLGFKPEKWTVKSEIFHPKDGKNAFDMTFSYLVPARKVQ